VHGVYILLHQQELKAIISTRLSDSSDRKDYRSYPKGEKKESKRTIQMRFDPEIFWMKLGIQNPKLKKNDPIQSVKIKIH
jgi:hypothetical protein